MEDLTCQFNDASDAHHAATPDANNNLNEGSEGQDSEEEKAVSDEDDDVSEGEDYSDDEGDEDNSCV